MNHSNENIDNHETTRVSADDTQATAETHDEADAGVCEPRGPVLVEVVEVPPRPDEGEQAPTTAMDASADEPGLRRRVVDAIESSRARVRELSTAVREQAAEALSFADEEEQRAYVLEMARSFTSGMLMTFNGSGDPHCRPMMIAEVERVDGEMRLWFVTDEESAKVDELGQDARASVTLQGGARYMAIYGHAHVIDDPAKLLALRQPSWRMWFDDTSKPTLIRVRVRQLEFWDQTGLRGLRVAFYAARALISGERLERTMAHDDWQHGRLVFA